MALIIENISNYLRKNSIKPSFQRIKIFEFLYQQDNHPTVDDIYRELVPVIPTLSKTTVYNTLGLFVTKGIAQQISIEDNESRYDAKINFHGHFKCENCGSVSDFELAETNIASIELAGFKINQRHVYFKGLCDVCQNKTKEH